MVVVLPGIQEWDSGDRQVRVKSLRAAAIICRDFIERNELPGGGWSGGQVYEGAQMVAEVSHNGTVWSRDGRELEV